MPAHYPTLQAQLKADLLDVLGAGSVVCFGRPKRPLTTFPHAVVRTSVSREMEGPRRVRETYFFEIECRFPIVDPNDDGCEVYAMERAELLIDRLVPHSEVTMPTPQVYAGVGNPNYVTMVEYVDSEDADPWIGFRLKFETQARTNQ